MEMGGDIVSLGAYYNVVCREEIPFTSREDYHQVSADLPYQIVAHFDPSFEIAVCEQWAVAPIDPAFTEPVASDIPVLLLAGEHDPYTPPRWTQMAAETLSNSHTYEFPGMAHAVTRYDECAIEVSRQFLNDLTVERCPWCLIGCTE
jgi:pimeloyl-ACP methyl ester carboxylesterase